MQRQSSIARWCERVIEGGWLLALVFIPGYFNLLSSRHFEPDKATSLRAIVLLMIAAGLIHWLDGLGASNVPAAPVAGRPAPRWWRRFVAFPMALPVALYMLVFVIATIFSVTPSTSLWGSYQRLQGTYTNFAYIGLGTMIVLFLRRRAQLERLLMIAVLGALPAVGYGLIQHFQVDPLPWKGDVIARVASTMGNSIFVSAYLILVLPFAAYLSLAGFQAARAASDLRRGSDYGWAAGYTLLVVGGLLLVYGALCFGAVVRTADLRYWWVFPGALMAACALFVVPTLRPHRADRVGLALLWPAIFAIVYVLLVGIAFAIGQASGVQDVRAQPGRSGAEWPLYMIAGSAAVIGAYALLLTQPRGSGESRVLLNMQGVGMAIVAALMVVTIIFTQSRGPWIGGLAGMFVFVTLLLLLAWRRGRANGEPRANTWRNLLIAEVVATVVVGGFLVVFNTSSAPVFQQLRNLPYIGRMGRLLEADEGTGLVRRLIWSGDQHAGGAVALITAEPFHTIFGWGPESMFVSYNRFYPPSLANIEARGASPDRSHEAYLDELVTKGVLGLVSYLFVLFSALALAATLLRRVDDWRYQALLCACIAVIAAHSVEGVTGIPIVATLMLLWVTLAVITVTGILAGEYSLRPQPAPSIEAPQAVAVAKAAPAGKRKGAAARGAAQGRVSTARRRESNPLALLVYAIILVVGLAAAWFTNVDNVYADMRFQQGQVYAENPNADLQQQLVGAQYYLDAIKMEPNQDFYYLSLGRSLMSVADISRQSQSAQLGTPNPNASMRDLLQTEDLRTFLTNQTQLGTMSYAETVLKQAYTINPMNKDHSANLGRLHSFWYSRMTQDPGQLQQAIASYQRAHEIAPQDVVILNEYAGTVALQGTYSESKGDKATATAKYDESYQLLEQSRTLDPRYGDTDARIADLLRVQGRTAEAVDAYIALLGRNPHALDTQYGNVIGSLKGDPAQLQRLRDAYEKELVKTPNDGVLHGIVGQIAVEMNDLGRATTAFEQQVKLQSTNLDAFRNLVVVLSDTKQYQRAADEADALRKLVGTQDQQQAGQLQALIDFFKQKAAGG